MDITLKRSTEDTTSTTSKRTKTETILINPSLEEEILPNDAIRSILSTSSHLIKTWQITDKFTLHSPNLISFTRCGRVPHLTPDLSTVELTGNTSLISLQSVIANPGINIIKQYGKPFKSFINEENKILIMTSYDIADGSNNTNFNDQNSVSVWSKGGRRKVTVKEYMEHIEVFSPDIFVCMSDNVPAGSSLKRADKACCRTLNWVNETVSYMSGSESNAKILAVIPGSGHKKLMMKSANILSNRNVFGYVIERVTLPKDWCSIVKDVISILPRERPVFMFGCLNSAEIVAAYSAGCHFVDTSFCLVYSNSGISLNFDVEDPEKVTLQNIPVCVDECKENTESFGPSLKMSLKPAYKKNNPEDDTSNQENTKKQKPKKGNGKIPIFTSEDFIPPSKNGSTYLDLKDTKLNKMFVGLQEGCQCITCSRHTKAYLNHLFVTTELLGPTLLMMHNLYHCRGLLKWVRNCVDKGELEQYMIKCTQAFSS